MTSDQPWMPGHSSFPPQYSRSCHKLPLCMATTRDSRNYLGVLNSPIGLPRISGRGAVNLLCNIFPQNDECQYVIVEYVLILCQFQWQFLAQKLFVD